MTEFFFETKDLIGKLKKELPDIRIVIGGIHATLSPVEGLSSGADFVLMGDGENPLIRLINKEDPEKISGLAFKKGNTYVINSTLNSDILDLEELPFPDWDTKHKFFLKSNRLRRLDIRTFRRGSTWKGSYYPLITTRGCIYKCSFCCNSCNINKFPLRRNSVSRIMEELDYIKKVLPFIRGLNIQDDSFFMGSDEFISNFCIELKKRFRWPFIVRMMPRFVTEERVRVMKDNGLEFVSIGLQGSDRLNKEVYNRPEKAEHFIKACKLLHKYKVNYIIDVLLDNPYETEEDLKEMALTLNELPKPFGLNAFSLTLFPATELYKRAIKEGMFSKFSTDAYNGNTFITYSFLTKLYQQRPMYITAKYKTPEYWRKFIYGVIPTAHKEFVIKILEDGINNEQSIKKVNNYHTKAKLLFKFVNLIKESNPFLFQKLLNAYNSIKNES